MSINLLEIMMPEAIKVPLESDTKRGCIEELVDVLAAAGRVADPDSLKNAVWERETTRTTGIGHSLAIPHGKCESVGDLAMAIGKPAEPIDFQSIDDRPVKLIVLLASPLERTSDHIQALAQVSRVMSDEGFREQVYQAETSEEMYELLQGRVMQQA